MKMSGWTCDYDNEPIPSGQAREVLVSEVVHAEELEKVIGPHNKPTQLTTETYVMCAEHTAYIREEDVPTDLERQVLITDYPDKEQT